MEYFTKIVTGQNRFIEMFSRKNVLKCIYLDHNVEAATRGVL